MRGKRFNPEQIIKIIKESDLGMQTSELCRKYGISEQTFYNWKNKYSGLDVSDALRLKSLETENHRLKRIVADLSLDNQVLKDLLEKKL